MFAIEVNFLTGRYVASAHHDRNQAEWPPHPARLFSALVATWADAEPPDQAERRGLEWIEAQSPPSIAAPKAVQRRVVTHFVPVNDARIVSQSQYERRAQTIAALEGQIAEARRGSQTKRLRTLESRLTKARDVSSVVSAVGNTPVRSAVDIMPPGWLSTSGNVRTGQARNYPSVGLADPRVTYIWESDPTRDLVETIDGLCSRLTRLGHSSSLVSCRVVGERPTPTFVPGAAGTVLRSVRSGQLDALEREYGKHQASRPRNLPFTPVSYRAITSGGSEEPPARPDTAGDWLVFGFRRGSKRYPSTVAVGVASALRGAVLHYATDPIPEGLSGHRKTGHPSTEPHVAFLPLPWVGNDHSDGRLMGVAVAMPRSLDAGSRRATLRSVGCWEQVQDPLILNLGRRGRLKMDRITGASPLVTLRPSVWRRAARRWVSTTPIALPTHPGRLSSGTAASRTKAWARAERAVVDSCRHVGLPVPTDVAVSLAPLIAGARPAPDFPAFRQPGTGGRLIARRLVHAAITFENPMVGPLVLGAGRYLGLGLMRPMLERGSSDG